MPPSISLTVAPDVAPKVRLGMVAASPVAIGPSGPPLLQEMEALAGRLASEHRGKPPAAVGGIAPARELYRSFAIDPTRTRPSSEALLRRVMKGKPLPRICNAVDLCTLCSLRFLLPIGLYDAGRIRGAAELRVGAAGDSYPGIRKDDVHLEGRPALFDEDGPFGNPTSDSRRTSVSGSTRALWMVIFAPPSLRPAVLEENVRFARASMARHLAPPRAAVETAGALWIDGALQPLEGDDR